MITIIFTIDGHDIIVPSHFVEYEDEATISAYLLTKLEEIEKKEKIKEGV
jgi:hypothetical protein